MKEMCVCYGFVLVPLAVLLFRLFVFLRVSLSLNFPVMFPAFHLSCHVLYVSPLANYYHGVSIAYKCLFMNLT